MVILRNKNKNFLNNYLYKYFNSIEIETQIKKVAFGSAQPQLTVKEINKFRISFPSLLEQEKIANFLSSLDKKIEIIALEIEKNKEFKKGLLQQMFV